MSAARTARCAAVIAVLLAVVLAVGGVALGFWAATDSSATHAGAAAAAALPQGATPATPTTNTSNGTTVTVSFPQVFTTAGHVAVTSYGVQRYPAGGGSAVFVSAGCSSAGGTITCVESAVPDGTWQYTDTPRFGANWVGAESATSATVTVDTTAPAVAVTFPVNGDGYNSAGWGGASGTFAGTASDATSGIPNAAAIRLRITQASTGRTWNGSSFASGTNTVAASSYSASTGNWSYAFAAASFPADGTYTVSATATDAAGNATTSGTTAFTIDNNLVVNITYPVDGGFYRSSGWAGTITGTSADSTSAVTSVRVSVQQGTGGCWTGLLNAFTASCPNYLPAVGTASWSEVFTTSSFNGDGAYTVKAQASDVAGNVQTTTHSFVYDNVAPSPTVTAPASGGFANSTTPTISGTAGTQSADGSHSPDSSTVTVRIFAGSGTGGTLLQTLNAAVSSGGAWSAVASALTASATYTAQVTQTDAAGNSASATSTFVIDTAAPAVTLTTPANGGAVTTQTPTLSGAAGQVAAATTASADSTAIAVNIYSGSSATGTPLQTLSTTRSAGSWSVVANTLAAGQYTAQATQSDGAGNVGQSSANTFTVALGPITAITFPADSASYNATGWSAAHGSCPSATICGTATASLGTVSTVGVQIKDVTTGLCWNGEGGGAAAFMSACVTGTGAGGFATVTSTGTNFSTWIIVGPAANRLTSGNTYLVTARGSDSAGTQSATATFTYDSTAPTISNVHVVNAATSGLDRVKPGGGFVVVATVSDASNAVASVTANVSALDGVAGDTAVTLTACNACSVRGTTYNYVSSQLSATASTGNKNITVTATDAAANADTTSNLAIAVDGTRPTITGVAITNKTGGIAGKPEPADLVTVTYSATLSVPSICSTWASSDATAGTISSTATVTLTKGSVDSLAVTTPDCALHVGSISLGATGYVNGGAGQVVTFAGSTVSWDGATHLYVSLGSTIGGTATQGTKATSSTATYTPHAAIASIAGNLISGTGTTGAQVLF